MKSPIPPIARFCPIDNWPLNREGQCTCYAPPCEYQGPGLTHTQILAEAEGLELGKEPITAEWVRWLRRG